MPERDTHKVVKTEVVSIKAGVYGVSFTFDDGTEDFAEAGSKKIAEYYAKAQEGETFPVGVPPLLLNAAKSAELRRRG